MLVDLFGSVLLQEYGEQRVNYNSEPNSDTLKSVGSKEEIIEVLSGFFRAHPKLFHDIRPYIPADNTYKSMVQERLKEARREGEEAAADAMKEHMDRLAVPLFTELALTYRKYQKLINVWSYHNDGTGWSKILLPEGTPVPAWMSKRQLTTEQKQFLQDLGMEVDIDTTTKKNSCWLDPLPVLHRQLKHLHKIGLLDLTDGVTVRVQVLGDATGIWRSLKVNGTTIVLKVWYDISGPKLHGQGVNTKANHRAIGFYLGDDCRAELQENLPTLPAMLERIQMGGVDVDLQEGRTVHVNIVLLLGGDLKFITGLLGIAGNANSFPCPFCEVADHKDSEQLHFTTGKLQDAGVSERTVEFLMQMAHVRPADDNSAYACPCCGKYIDTQVEYDTGWSDDKRRKWQQVHRGCTQGNGPFFRCIPVSHVIIDALHIVLRLTPAVWRATVSAHVTGDRLGALHQWVYDNVNVIIAKNTAVQSKSGRSKQCKIGTECWPGRTCITIMDWYEEILSQVHSGSDANLTNAMKVWEALITFYSEMLHGCDDEDPVSKSVHAETLRVMAQVLVREFVQGAGAVKKVIVYMHVIQVHVPQQVRRWGSLSKGSSQGAEALHQHSQRDAQVSNRKTTASFCLKQNALRGLVNESFIDTTRGGAKELLPGGHKSKGERTRHNATVQKARDNFFSREKFIPRTF